MHNGFIYACFCLCIAESNWPFVKNIATYINYLLQNNYLYKYALNI